MNKLIKHKWEDRNKIFFSSDWHNFHDPKWDIPIWKMRGYNSAKESQEDVIYKVNSRVKEDDIIYYLGDGFLNTTDEEVVEWLSKINCRNIRYIMGNHESHMSRLYQKEIKLQYGLDDVEVYPLRMNNVVFYGNHQEIQIGKKRIVLNHFPIHSWHHMNHGGWHLSGHQHNDDHTRNPDYQLGKTFDVGWDWKRDVWSFGEVEEVMSTKEILQEGHH